MGLFSSNKPGSTEMDTAPTTVRAVWNGRVLAESSDTIEIEGNQYFPPESVNRELFAESDERTTCPWKGTASYYDLVVDGETNAGGAWYYPEPNEAAEGIKDMVAFWRGVNVEQD